MPTSRPLRRIRSFVRRGRVTAAQARALRQLLPEYTYHPGHFPQQSGQRLYLEIGFGNGDSLAAMAAENPDACFIGIEVHQAGVGRLLLNLAQRQLHNVRLLNTDAIEVLQQGRLELLFDGIYLLFPDPWPKKKHHKRRILTREFAAQVSSHLKPGGYFCIATDWQEYADAIVTTLENVPALQPVNNPQSLPAFIPRPATKYELRGRRLKHKVIDLVYRRATA